MSAGGWVYVEAKGNFQIHRYMYSNGMIIEEAEVANQTGLWSFVNLGAPLPAQRELGAFSFRAQCMACHADWTESKNPVRSPGFRFEGDALRFLEKIRDKHPPYPIFAGAPEERYALAAYLEDLIAKSGRTLEARPEPSRASRKPEAPPEMVSTTPPQGEEKRSENLELSKPDAAEKSVAAPAVQAPAAAPEPEKTQEAKAPGQEGRPAGSSAASLPAEEAKKPQDGAPAGVSASPASLKPPDSGRPPENAQEDGISPEKNNAASSTSNTSNDSQGVEVEQSPRTESLGSMGGSSGFSPTPSDAKDEARKSQEELMQEKQESAAASPAPSSTAPGNGSPAGGEGMSAVRAAPSEGPHNAEKRNENNSP